MHVRHSLVTHPGGGYIVSGAARTGSGFVNVGTQGRCWSAMLCHSARVIEVDTTLIMIYIVLVSNNAAARTGGRTVHDGRLKASSNLAWVDIYCVGTCGSCPAAPSR
jgi:hypothetical protein